ncbi:MAG TPA: argininosuccinate lyase [Acidimicrobiia bacterium]|nr:argininosuccinate lyase [Acidimicrobiia bacterium]
MTLWGGRFGGEMSDITRRFTGDTSDRRLLPFDVEGSIAHVAMLGKTGIITAEDADILTGGLRDILDTLDEFEFQDTDEDVHTAVERRLGELVGDLAGKLHTGRSRNDQVALDLRLYLRTAAAERVAQLRSWVEALMKLAGATADVPIATYTHLQQAQATSLGNHLLAYAWMAVRDMGRFSDCALRMNESPLGAGASAGSTLPLDRDAVTTALEMDRPMPNTLDAVGSRDFVAEYVFCCAQAMVHLSRLAEELVIWSSKEFGWVSLGDEVSTGSSALPHKRNPDIAELIRGRAATVSGDVTAILSLQKALPLAYNRDLQEDKRIVFHADDTLASALEAIAALLSGIEFSPPGPGAETSALDIAEAMVERGVPFRQAHLLVGRLVKMLEDDDRSLQQATTADLAAVDDSLSPSDLELIDPTNSLSRPNASKSRGSQAVRAQIDALRDFLQE